MSMGCSASPRSASGRSRRPLPGRCEQPREGCRDGRQVAVERHAAAGDEALLQLGGCHALGAQDARRRRHQDAADAELARDLDRMQRARPAERHQREGARIMAALDRDDADGAHHVGVDDAHDAERRLAQRRVRAFSASGAMAASARRRSRRMPPPISSSGRRPSTRLASETVGSRAAPAVAGRPRHGAGAHGPDAHQAVAADMGDRPAAGADGVDVDGGETHGKARDAAAERHLRLAVAHEADVGRGAAHVEGDEIAAAGRARRRRRRRRPPPPAPTARCGSASRPRASTDIRPPEDWQMPMPAPGACAFDRSLAGAPCSGRRPAAGRR